MKKQIIFTAVLAIGFSISSIAQVGGIGGSEYQMTFVPGEKFDNTAEFKRIAPKMYGTVAYLPAQVEGIKETFFLRHNMYRDEMEFSKNGQTLYLQKNDERKITFSESNEVYGLFKLEGKLRYFLIHNEGDNVLLSRKVVEYKEAKPAMSSYQKDRPADFKREDDELYLKTTNGNITEIPRSKKKFYALFGENVSKIKKYIKKNKLDIKDVKDLKGIIAYSNTI